MCVGGRGPHSQEAVATVNRATLRRSERYCRFNRAQRALDRYFHALPWKGLSVGMHVRRDAFVLLEFARLTPLWIVSQTLVRKEQLFSRSEHEFLVAIDTPENLIVVLVHLGLLRITRRACRRVISFSRSSS